MYHIYGKVCVCFTVLSCNRVYTVIFYSFKTVIINRVFIVMINSKLNQKDNLIR